MNARSTLPFRVEPVVDEQLRSPNGDGRIRLLPGDERWVIRWVTPKQCEMHPDLPARTHAAHADLESSGIAIPPRAYVLAEERPGSGPGMLILTARVAGGSLADAISTSEEARRAAEATLGCVLGYYARAYVDRTAYRPDVHLGQFMWGTVPGSRTPEAWMIDLDPGSTPLPQEPDAREIALLHWWIGETANFAIEVERRSGKRVRDYRSQLDALADGPVFADPSATGRLERMRAALAAGEPFDPHQEWLLPLL